LEKKAREELRKQRKELRTGGGFDLNKAKKNRESVGKMKE